MKPPFHLYILSIFSSRSFNISLMIIFKSCVIILPYGSTLSMILLIALSLHNGSLFLLFFFVCLFLCLILFFLNAIIIHNMIQTEGNSIHLRNASFSVISLVWINLVEQGLDFVVVKIIFSTRQASNLSSGWRELPCVFLSVLALLSASEVCAHLSTG